MEAHSVLTGSTLRTSQLVWNSRDTFPLGVGFGINEISVGNEAGDAAWPGHPRSILKVPRIENGDGGYLLEELATNQAKATEAIRLDRNG